MGNKVEVNRIRKGFESKDHGRYHYQYDELNRLTMVSKDRDVLRSYDYDSFGNRTKMTEKGKSTSYTYNRLNQLISKHDNAGDNFNYIYDRRGNSSETYKNDTLTHFHHFGVLNRLESAYNYEQEEAVSYDYNGLGNRIGKRIGILEEPVVPNVDFHGIDILIQQHVEDVIDLTKPYHNLLERKENGNAISFIYDFNVLSANSEKETFHYFQDDLGSPIRLMNDHGHENAFSYDEFGGIAHKKGLTSSGNPFAYTGYQLDNTSETLFAQQRQYDPKVGRFISEDLVKGFVELPQSFNSYVYCWNQPIDFIDLDGLFLRRVANAVTNVASNVVSNVADGIGNAVNGIGNVVDATGQWISDNSSAIIAGVVGTVVVVGAVALVVKTGGVAAPLLAGKLGLGGSVGGAIGGFSHVASGGENFWHGFAGGFVNGVATTAGGLIGMPQIGSFVGGSTGSLITNLLEQPDIGFEELVLRAGMDGIVQNFFSNFTNSLFPPLSGIEEMILIYYRNVYTIGGGSIISSIILDVIFDAIFNSSDECELQ